MRDTADISISGLVVRRGTFQLGPVDLAVRPSEILVLLGENGAGKTTLITSALGLLPRDAGEVAVAGHRVEGRSPDVLASVGYVPDSDRGLIDELTAPELWDLRAHIVRGLGGGRDAIAERAASLAERLRFAPAEGKRIKDFSHGMQKKTMLVGALQHDPPVVVLDEPRSGLDPMGIRMLEELIREAAGRRRAVVCSTHDVHWAYRISTHAPIPCAGELATAGPISDLAADAQALEDLFFRLTSPSVSATAAPPEGG